VYEGKLDGWHFDAMERLLPNGTWARGNSEQAQRDFFRGWFDEEEEMTVNEVRELIQRWLEDGKLSARPEDISVS